jgi:diaminopimelate decarboxylase
MADGNRQRLIRAAARAARGRRTPFYLFDGSRASRSLAAWTRAVRDPAALFYPYKCNRHPALLDLAARAGWGAEVTAAEDLEAAVARTGGGGRVLFQGPAKTAAAIDAALSAGAWLVADSPADTLAILERARAIRVAPRYLLRFRPAAAEASQRRFGMPAAELLRVARRLVRESRPAPGGLAFHLGTGIASPSSYCAAVREAGRLASGLTALGWTWTAGVLDVGGGFAAQGESRRDARGRPRGTAASPAGFVAEIQEAARRAIPGARLVFEPGRAVASDAFHLVTRVVRATSPRVHVDASRLSHAFFVPRGRHAFVPVPRRRGAGATEVAGPLPVDLDVFSAGESIGRPREGDLLVVESVGAYNLIAANAWAGRIPEVVEIG